jgi:cation transport ATPase
MAKKEKNGIIILLIVSFVLTLAVGWLMKGVSAKFSSEYIEFLIGLAITLAGFGLVAFQIAKASNELKKDFLESSILMILSALFGIGYWIYLKQSILAWLSSLFFLWSLILLLIILIDRRFDILK